MTDLSQAVPEASCSTANGSGFTRTLGLVLGEVTGRGVRAWAQVDATHHQEHGIVHVGGTRP